MPRQKWRCLVAIVAVLAACESAAFAELRVVQSGSTVSILDGDRPILRCRCAGVAVKPYADRFFSPAGVQILRDSPPDHRHHHGMMFALDVDGVNFWEEDRPNSGRQNLDSLDISPSTIGSGRSRAGFVQTLSWVGPKKNRLLIERRTIEAIQVPKSGVSLIEWRCCLEAPPGKSKATLSGNFYFGLGMRFVASMDRDGRFFDADDRAGEAVGQNHQLTPTKWLAYAAKADGKPVTVAIFDHPQNIRHPARMFSMTAPFAYLAATRNEWREPIVVEAGKPLELRYGVALLDGEADKAVVEKLYSQWLANAKP